MASQKNDTFYRKVVAVTDQYLGPAAERFVDRQVYNHLKKDPEKLAESDLEQLVDWIRIAFAFLTEDSKLVDEYTDSLRLLVSDKHKQRKQS
jgi:hypothetical protein